MEIIKVVQIIGKYWDGRSHNFDEEHDTEDIPAWMNALEELLGSDKNKSVLDLGTGTGFLANMTARMGFSSIGLDISREMLKYAVKHASTRGTNAVFMFGNVHTLPFTDDTIDYIINSRLIWTLVEPDEAIIEWRRILKPGGKILCFHRMKEEVGIVLNKVNIYEDDEVDRELRVKAARMDELVDLLLRNGLVDVEIKKLPGLTRPGYDYEPWFVLMGTKASA
ncbi:MAG: class I SAM-dependent methyltransferase [Syntrophomonadaceae bacterium]